MKRLAIIAAALFVAAGCATTVLQRQTFQSYSVGEIREATVGEPFIVDQKGSIEKVRIWVGILNSPDGWKTENRYSEDWLRRELLYSGRSGNTVEINYREFRGGYAAAPFYQAVKYDLNDSSTIRFRQFVIEVIQANNQRFKYRIVSDQ